MITYTLCGWRLGENHLDYCNYKKLWSSLGITEEQFGNWTDFWGEDYYKWYNNLVKLLDTLPLDIHTVYDPMSYTLIVGIGTLDADGGTIEMSLSELKDMEVLHDTLSELSVDESLNLQFFFGNVDDDG